MTLRVKFTCSHCGGAGFVDETKLSPYQRKILAAVRSVPHANGIRATRLVEEVYKGTKPPFWALEVIQAAIRSINRRMQGRKIVVKDRRHPEKLRYCWTKVEEDHHDNTDHRKSHDHAVRRPAALGGDGSRQAE